MLAKLQDDDPSILESSYVAFLMHFVKGRGSDPDSGIVAAMDAFFNRNVEEMKSETLSTVITKLDSVKANKTKNTALTESIRAATTFALLAADCQKLYELCENHEDGNIINVGSSYKNFTESMEFIPKYLALYDDMIQNRNDLNVQKKSSDENLIAFKNEKPTNAATSKSFAAVLNDVFSYEKIKDSAAT